MTLSSIVSSIVTSIVYNIQGRIQDLWKGGAQRLPSLKTLFGISKGGRAPPAPPPPESASDIRHLGDGSPSLHKSTFFKNLEVGAYLLIQLNLANPRLDKILFNTNGFKDIDQSRIFVNGGPNLHKWAFGKNWKYSFAIPWPCNPSLEEIN